ncbi:MAG TPA: tetratricopeptide repeat protein [Streptosporangiaceae bacterium]|nr:tetratricopeptide repeat protein [Streptosporangiaceae bacterium]
MPLFHVTVREHTYTGRFYHDVVQAGSFQQALQLAAGHAAEPQPPAAQPQREFNVEATEHPPTGRPDRDVTPAKPCEQAQHPAAGHAAAPQPPAAPPQRGFNVAVTEHAPAGRSYTDVVQAGSFQQALQLAAERASVPHPPPVSAPQPGAAVGPRCADVWVYSLLRCELAEGHDPPHMAVAPGYRRPVRWVRDHRGLAHALPEPAGQPSAMSQATQLPPAPEGESPQVPPAGGDEAARQHRRALGIFERLGDQAGMADSYGRLGNVAYLRGDYDEAARQYQRALGIFERLGNVDKTGDGTA